MSAYLTIFDTGEIINEEEIVEFINDSGIKYGFQTAKKKISELNEKKQFGKPFLIALSDKSDQKVEFQFLLNRKNFLNPNLTLDINNILNKEVVKENDAIINVITKDSELQSLNILGEKFIENSKASILIENFIGENVYYSTGKNQICAQKSGYPYLDNKNRICVKSEIIITKDIINKDLHIICDLIVKGNIIDSQVVVEKNLTVEGEICSPEKIVFVKKDLDVNDINHSIILCKGNLNFKEKIQRSNVNVDKFVFGSFNSEISESNVQAGEGIIAATVGSNRAEKTELEISILPVLKYQMSELGFTEQNYEIKYENRLIKVLRQNFAESSIKIFKIVFPNSYFRILNRSELINKKQESYSISL
ncbi:MAG: hypothetical protein K8S23_16185 [Candidatus Cloacimonetes bacterium]|nr:hypothetical protein [Candidatus Cloacimonadota bacterium]